MMDVIRYQTDSAIGLSKKCFFLFCAPTFIIQNKGTGLSQIYSNRGIP